MVGMAVGTSVAIADTTVIREMAKNATDVVIVTSGDKARAFGERLARTLRTHKEYNDNRKKKKVVVVSLAEAEAMAKDPAFERMSKVSVLADEEAVAPTSLANVLDLPNTPKEQYMSYARVKTYGTQAGKQIFSVALRAPDEERLARVYDVFDKSNGSDYKRLDFNATYASNRVFVHTNAEAAANWGAVGGAWNYVTPAKMGDEAPGEGAPAEADFAYLVDRSTPCEAMPPAVLDLFRKQGIRPTTALAMNVKLPNGRRMALLTAPNGDHLKRLAEQFDNVAAIPSTGFRRELPDLRFLSRDFSVVKANLSLPGEEQPQIVDALLQHMGLKMREGKVRVLENTGLKKLLESISTDQQLGATDTRIRLRRAGTRYVWYLSVTNVTRSTEYGSNTVRLGSGSSRPVFNEARPEPYRKEDSSDYQARLAAWSERRAQHERDLDEWANRTPVQYRLQVNKTQKSIFEVQFKLFDLTREAGEVTWETMVNGTNSVSSTQQSREVTVNGNLSRPNPLVAPASESNCDISVVLGATRNAAEKALEVLATNGWVAGDPVVKFWEDTSEAKPTAGLVTKGSGTVTARTASGLVVNLGENAMAIRGDSITVRGPNGAPLKFIVATVEGRKVTCTAADAAAKKALATIKTGAAVTWQAAEAKS